MTCHCVQHKRHFTCAYIHLSFAHTQTCQCVTNVYCTVPVTTLPPVQYTSVLARLCWWQPISEARFCLAATSASQRGKPIDFQHRWMLQDRVFSQMKHHLRSTTPMCMGPKTAQQPSSHSFSWCLQKLTEVVKVRRHGHDCLNIGGIHCDQTIYGQLNHLV